MNHKYKVSKLGSSLIEKLECTKETEKSVWVMERRFSFDDEQPKFTEIRYLKKTSYSSFFDTFEDAKNHLINNARQRIGSLKEQLMKAEKSLSRFKKLNNE